MLADRSWNTWDNACPAAVLDLASGLGLRVSTWSTAAGTFQVPATSDVSLLEHEPDGSRHRVLIHHAGSEVEWAVLRAAPQVVVARLKLQHAAEWALRFWMHLDIGGLHPGVRAGGVGEFPLAEEAVSARVWSDPLGTAHPVSHATVSVARTSVAVQTFPAAARLGIYAELGELKKELTEGGYYHPHRDEVGGRAQRSVLRFSGQEQAEVVVVIGQGPDEHTAIAAADVPEADARELFDNLDERAYRFPVAVSKDPAAAAAKSAAAAIRDVVGWNTIHDRANQRIQTVATRHWTDRKFGGFGVWLTDTFYAALLAASIGDSALARANLFVATDHASPLGNLPGLVTGHEYWVDRSQPPVGAFVLRRIHDLLPMPQVVAELLPTLERNNDWWWTTRRIKAHDLVTYGSSPVGRATFAFTRQGALNESSMDNMAMFDGAAFDPDTGLLDEIDPGVNALLALDSECLGVLRQGMGEPEAAQRWFDRADRLKAAIGRLLWDESRGTFAPRRVADGTLVQRVSPTCFFPLLTGGVQPDRARRLLDSHLLNESTFWGTRPLPSSPANDPASADNVYWRGRIWPPHIFLVYEGLRREGYDDEASMLAQRSWSMFSQAWEQRRCPENFSMDGLSDVGPDVDPFYTWGALIPYVCVREQEPSRW